VSGLRAGWCKSMAMRLDLVMLIIARRRDQERRETNGGCARGEKARTLGNPQQRALWGAPLFRLGGGQKMHGGKKAGTPRVKLGGAHSPSRGKEEGREQGRAGGRQREAGPGRKSRSRPSIGCFHLFWAAAPPPTVMAKCEPGHRRFRPAHHSLLSLLVSSPAVMNEVEHWDRTMSPFATTAAGDGPPSRDPAPS